MPNDSSVYQLTPKNTPEAPQNLPESSLQDARHDLETIYSRAAGDAVRSTVDVPAAVELTTSPVPDVAPLEPVVVPTNHSITRLVREGQALHVRNASAEELQEIANARTLSRSVVTMRHNRAQQFVAQRASGGTRV